MSIARSAVYFAYLGEEGTEEAVVRQRFEFMGRQLRWLAGLVEASPHETGVLVAYVAPRTWDADIHRVAAQYAFRIDPASLASDRRNRYEYPGIRAMKTLAEGSAPDHLIFYCHSKGIVELDESKMGMFRLHTEVGLTADIDPLVTDPSLTRAGMFPFRYGWCWYNFFWIKAGYMARLPVAESTDRYYFEEVIGDRGNKEGYKGVLPLIDRVPFEDTGIPVKHWYYPEETTSPTLLATFDRYARMSSPPLTAASNEA